MFSFLLEDTRTFFHPKVILLVLKHSVISSNKEIESSDSHFYTYVLRMSERTFCDIFVYKILKSLLDTELLFGMAKSSGNKRVMVVIQHCKCT